MEAYLCQVPEGLSFIQLNWHLFSDPRDKTDGRNCFDAKSGR